MKNINLPLFWVLIVVLMASCSGGGGGGVMPPTATGSATLTWKAPTQNADNSQLVDLQGYKVYYSDVPGHYDYVVDVGNVTTYTLTNFPARSRYWYFVVRAYNQAGVESDLSNEQSKFIQ